MRFGMLSKERVSAEAAWQPGLAGFQDLIRTPHMPGSPSFPMESLSIIGCHVRPPVGLLTQPAHTLEHEIWDNIIEMMTSL